LSLNLSVSPHRELLFEVIHLRKDKAEIPNIPACGRQGTPNIVCRSFYRFPNFEEGTRIFNHCCPTKVGQKMLHQLLTGRFQTNLLEQKSGQLTTLIYTRNDNKSK
jgi:hypothetical protein